MRIAIFGLGYVGTVTAAGLASQGPRRVRSRRRRGEGRSHQIGAESCCRAGYRRTDSDCSRAVAGLRATTDPVVALDRADVSLLCVGTPSLPHGGTDLTYLRRALEDIRRGLTAATPPASGFHAVVVRSTVPPGTGDDLVARDLRRDAATGGLGSGNGDVPGVSPRGLGRRGLLQPAVRRPRHRRSARDRPADRDVLVP